MKKNKLPLLLAMCLSLGVFSSCDNQNANKSEEKVESKENNVKETGENKENSNKDQKKKQAKLQMLLTHQVHMNPKQKDTKELLK